MQDYAAFLGWAFPGVPASARLIYAQGVSPLPSAGGVDPYDGYIDGLEPFGGTDYLFAVAEDPELQQPRVRPLALGLELGKHARGFSGFGNLAPAAAASLLPLLAFTDGAALAPTQTFRQLVFTSYNGDFSLKLNGPVVGYFGLNAGPLVIGEGYLSGGLGDQVTNVGAGAADWACRGVDDDDVRLYDVRAGLVVGDFEGGAVQNIRALAPGRTGPPYMPAAAGAGVSRLWPIQPSVQGVTLRANEYVGVGLSRPAAMDLPESAKVHATLALAVWDDAEES